MCHQLLWKFGFQYTVINVPQTFNSMVGCIPFYISGREAWYRILLPCLICAQMKIFFKKNCWVVVFFRTIMIDKAYPQFWPGLLLVILKSFWGVKLFLGKYGKKNKDPQMAGRKYFFLNSNFFLFLWLPKLQEPNEIINAIFYCRQNYENYFSSALCLPKSYASGI